MSSNLQSFQDFCSNMPEPIESYDEIYVVTKKGSIIISYKFVDNLINSITYDPNADLTKLNLTGASYEMPGTS